MGDANLIFTLYFARFLYGAPDSSCDYKLMVKRIVNEDLMYGA